MTLLPCLQHNSLFESCVCGPTSISAPYQEESAHHRLSTRGLRPLGAMLVRLLCSLRTKPHAEPCCRRRFVVGPLTAPTRPSSSSSSCPVFSARPYSGCSGCLDPPHARAVVRSHSASAIQPHTCQKEQGGPLSCLERILHGWSARTLVLSPLEACPCASWDRPRPGAKHVRSRCQLTCTEHLKARPI
eukprot:SAG31_NODE_1594_length_7791_cov_2.912192_2_plen_188_part_00